MARQKATRSVRKAAMKLNAQSLTPLYQQVSEEIRAAIVSGALVSGERISSEAELSETYSVSRVTVRRAIEELVGEGYLTTRQGKGTFVNRRKLERKLCQTSDVTSFTNLCASMDMVAGARVQDRRVVPADADERKFFGSECENLVFVSRIRTADGVPIMEECNYLPLEGFEFLLNVELDDVSLFSTLYERTGRRVERSLASSIEIALAGASMAEVLDVSAGDPLFFEHVWLLDGDGRPICESRKYLVGSRYVFKF